MKHYPIARILVPVLILCVALFVDHRVSSYYIPAKMTFLHYCEENHLDYSYYIWVVGKSRIGYSYVDYAPEWGTAPPAYRVTVPWVGKAWVTTLSPKNAKAPTGAASPAQCVKGYFQNMFVSANANRMRRVDYIESKLGIQRYDFKFSFPHDKKVLATFKIEMDGKALNEEALGTYAIMPPENPQAAEQRISICFFAPNYPINAADQAVCDVSLDDKWNFSFRIPRAAVATPYGAETHQEPPTQIEADKDYLVWSHVVHGEGKTEKLRCTLTIRVEPLVAGDEVGKVLKK